MPVNAKLPVKDNGLPIVAEADESIVPPAIVSVAEPKAELLLILSVPADAPSETPPVIVFEPDSVILPAPVCDIPLVDIVKFALISAMPVVNVEVMPVNNSELVEEMVVALVIDSAP